MKNDQLNKRIKNLIDDRMSMSPEEKIAEAGVVISSLKKVDTRSGLQKVKQHAARRMKVIRLVHTITRVAAILLVPVLLYSLWSTSQLLSFKGDREFAMQELYSPAGIRSQVSLPDGTKVWLNAGSTVRFQVPFVNDQRDVYLSGEAFFDVVKNAKIPLVVHAGQTQVNVLGTKFNCKAYSQDEQIEVVLVEGKVSLQTDENGAAKQTFIMKPNEHALINKRSGQTRIVEEDIDKYIAWHRGRLVFDNNTLDEVAEQLERWYRIDVIISDQEIRGYRYTTTFENETLHQVMELLCLSTPVETKYIPSSENKPYQRPTLYISKKQ